MSSNVPAHKQTDPTMKPGQQINPLGFAIQPSEKTLDEYIRRKEKQHMSLADSLFDSENKRLRRRPPHEALDSVTKEKKLTFYEWYKKHWACFHWPLTMKDIQMVWEAAQENK